LVSANRIKHSKTVVKNKSKIFKKISTYNNCCEKNNFKKRFVYLEKAITFTKQLIVLYTPTLIETSVKSSFSITVMPLFHQGK